MTTLTKSHNAKLPPAHEYAAHLEKHLPTVRPSRWRAVAELVVPVLLGIVAGVGAYLSLP